jgi:hypothetical protein
MKDTKSDRLAKNIESMTFDFPYPDIGHSIDPITGKGQPSESLSDEEDVNLRIQIRGERAIRVMSGAGALSIYEAVWRFLNEEESKNTQT